MKACSISLLLPQGKLRHDVEAAAEVQSSSHGVLSQTKKQPVPGTSHAGTMTARGPSGTASQLLHRVTGDLRHSPLPVALLPVPEAPHLCKQQVLLGVVVQPRTSQRRSWKAHWEMTE